VFFGWKPYVSAAERRKKAERHQARLRKQGQKLSPVAASRGAIARTFWGRAWCDNLEHYSDYSNRLPRGRTYVRNGSVIDLKIAAGEIKAQVVGSDIYTTSVKISALPKKGWHALAADCSGSIDSLVELLQGQLSKGVMERICQPDTGLFPSPKEITFNCSCPDWAAMCKHVAAVLYGVGARLDQKPELLFTLRHVDAKDLVARAGEDLPIARRRPTGAKVLEDSKLDEVFGIEMAEVATKVGVVDVPGSRGKRAAAKPSSARKNAGKRKPPATARTRGKATPVRKKRRR